MSYHVSETEIERALGATAEAALTGSESGTLAQVIGQASAVVDSIIAAAGYSAPATTSSDQSAAPDLIKLATIGVVAQLLYAKRGLRPPEALFVYGSAIAQLEKLAEAGAQIPGLAPAAKSAVGGIAFSDSSSTGRPRRFGTLRTVY